MIPKHLSSDLIILDLKHFYVCFINTLLLPTLRICGVECRQGKMEGIRQLLIGFFHLSESKKEQHLNLVIDTVPISQSCFNKHSMENSKITKQISGET